MDFTGNFWDVLLWTLWIFVWIGAIVIWFRCLVDMFSDDSLSGWGKAAWAVVLIFVPWLGVIVYLVARGRSMSDRQAAATKAQQDAQDAYVRQVVGASASPAEQLSQAKSLLDSGAITPSEYDALKAKALV
jgi:hypothetical protein